MSERKYLPTLSELIDRLSIVQLKEVFISEHKDEYSQEIGDILHDIQLLLNQNDDKITSETIRAIVVLSQMNLHIWHNESNYRKGIKDGNNLELTHGLNDSTVDYGVEKLNDSSLKIKKLTDTQQPSGSFLSSSVDRVYV